MIHVRDIQGLDMGLRWLLFRCCLCVLLDKPFPVLRIYSNYFLIKFVLFDWSKSGDSHGFNGW